MTGGRPRTFDPDEALQKALDLFWAQGYEGTSVAELADAMGVNPPSLYSAFGSKRELFERAADRYADSRGPSVEKAMAESDVADAIRGFLRTAIESYTQPGHPAGCLFVQGALVGSPEDREIGELLAGRRSATREALKVRFERAATEGQLVTGSDPEVLSRLFAAIAEGFAVEAAGGASRKQLLDSVEVAMGALPVASRQN